MHALLVSFVNIRRSLCSKGRLKKGCLQFMNTCLSSSLSPYQPVYDKGENKILLNKGLCILIKETIWARGNPSLCTNKCPHLNTFWLSADTISQQPVGNVRSLPIRYYLDFLWHLSLGIKAATKKIVSCVHEQVIMATPANQTIPKG